MSREVEIAFEPADLAPVVMGDAISIREALGNLIHNALVHGARCRLIVAVGQNGDSAWIEVRDDGAVFDPTTAQQLVTPFAKGEGSSGSGLGLSIAAQVARAHGGSLNFARCDGLTTVRLSIRRDAV
jgi:two-component system sensor histidine kinase TctE